MDIPQTSSAVPSAAFHVGAIQILRAEVFGLRHPSVSIQKFYESADGGKKDGDLGGEVSMLFTLFILNTLTRTAPQCVSIV